MFVALSDWSQVPTVNTLENSDPQGASKNGCFSSSTFVAGTTENTHTENGSLF